MRCPSNTHSIEIDGVLAGGRGFETRRHACYISTIHPFKTNYKGPDENSVSHCHKVPCHELIYVFDFELGQKMHNIFFKHGAGVEFISETYCQNVCFKDGNFRWSNRDVEKECFHWTFRVFIWVETPRNLRREAARWIRMML